MSIIDILKTISYNQFALKICSMIMVNFLHNVIDGFEGNLNHERQRASIDGWQFNKLPWKQQ